MIASPIGTANEQVRSANADADEAATKGAVDAKDIERIARSIGSGPLGLAWHRPQPWASPLRCYNNAIDMVEREGGRVRCGWTFHVRTRSDMGNYVFCTPHAVWHNPKDLSLVDVTPHPDPFHAPIMQDNSILFLVDAAAEPIVITDQVILSPPLRYFAVGGSRDLSAYVAELNARAVANFELEKRDALGGNRR